MGWAKKKKETKKTGPQWYVEFVIHLQHWIDVVIFAHRHTAFPEGYSRQNSNTHLSADRYFSTDSDSVVFCPQMSTNRCYGGGASWFGTWAKRASERPMIRTQVISTIFPELKTCWQCPCRLPYEGSRSYLSFCVQLWLKTKAGCIFLCVCVRLLVSWCFTRMLFWVSVGTSERASLFRWGIASRLELPSEKTLRKQLRSG